MLGSPGAERRDWARLFSFESRLSISAAASLLRRALASLSPSHYGVNFQDCITLAQENSGVKNVVNVGKGPKEMACFFPSVISQVKSNVSTPSVF